MWMMMMTVYIQHMYMYGTYVSVCILHILATHVCYHGWSALMLAAGWSKTEVVVGLVKARANVDMQDNVCQYIYVVHDVRKLYMYMYIHARVHIQ